MCRLRTRGLSWVIVVIDVSSCVSNKTIAIIHLPVSSCGRRKEATDRFHLTPQRTEWSVYRLSNGQT
jgi:hypothetical protein